MNISYRDYDKPGVLLKYSQDGNVFSILDSEENVISECYPLLNLDTEYNPNNFFVYQLKNNRIECTENSIYQVYVGKQRIGWIFPIQALLSNEHEQADNIYFLKYAFVAYYNLINDIEENNKRDSISTICLSDFYDDDIILLVVDKENIGKLDNFNIADYTVGLFKYGYGYSGKGNVFSETIEIEKNIRIKPISPYIEDREYILNIFKEELTKERESFATFHILYQIIEFLIFKVFKNEFSSFITTIQNDDTTLFDKKEELGSITNEKHRIIKLFNNYVKIDSDDQKLLNDRCKKILAINGKEIKESAPENLYQVRNLIVHSMYILSQESHEILEKINNVFVDVVMDMIFTFENPQK